MLSFPIESVRAVIARGRADAEANGGYRNPHYGLHPGRDEQPGVWLVGDHGVYLCFNGKLPDGEKPFVAYALECDPRTNDGWFEVKRKTFGGRRRCRIHRCLPAGGDDRRRLQCQVPRHQLPAGLDGALNHRVVVTFPPQRDPQRQSASLRRQSPRRTDDARIHMEI